jgi:hypothetical protein
MSNVLFRRLVSFLFIKLIVEAAIFLLNRPTVSIRDVSLNAGVIKIHNRLVTR